MRKAGKLRKAIAQYRDVLKHHPGFVASIINLARIVASDAPNRQQINEVIVMVEPACKGTGYKDLKTLNTLALLYGKVGRFDDAAATIEQMLSVARAKGMSSLVLELERRLQIYKNKNVGRSD